jgi:hypothetical protein
MGITSACPPLVVVRSYERDGDHVRGEVRPSGAARTAPPCACPCRSPRRRRPAVNRMLEGLRTWFGLPDAASHLLEADREALKMGRYEYILHVLFQRSLELREKGAGFDVPGGGERKKR